MDIAYCGPAPSPATLLASWNLDPVAIGLSVVLCLAAPRLRADRRAPLLSATALLLVLFVSPFCALTAALFSARVAHHVILVAVAAPLMALAFPARSRGALMLPLGALVVLQAAVLWAWHWPDLYAAALYSGPLYWTMQLTLLGTAVLFWRAIFSEHDPFRSLPALLATIVQMGMLGALLTFAPRPLYGPHLFTTAPFGLDPLQDQQLGGLLMWVPAALPYLIVALRLVLLRLGPAEAEEPRAG